MPLIGYARVSSSGQSLEVQRDQLLAAGCTRIFEEKRSGLSQDGREQLALALDYVRDGDVLIVTRLDRLARSITDLRQIVDRLTVKEVGFRALQQGDLDTSTSNGRLMLNMLGAFAEFEADLRRERQREGIDKAKANGIYKGRKPTVPVDDDVTPVSHPAITRVLW
jgi:DNA invertase Pin-like site-specific DNA recombinase